MQSCIVRIKILWLIITRFYQKSQKYLIIQEHNAAYSTQLRELKPRRNNVIAFSLLSNADERRIRYNHWSDELLEFYLKGTKIQGRDL